MLNRYAVGRPNRVRKSQLAHGIKSPSLAPADPKKRVNALQMEDKARSNSANRDQTPQWIRT
jgi:hypothetical protein